MDITVLKVDEADPDQHLSGAEFQILMWSEENSRYLPLNLDTLEFAETGEEAASKRTTGPDGTLKFENLREGRYQIVETKSPAGYILEDEVEMFFTIENSVVIWTDENGNVIQTDETVPGSEPDQGGNEGEPGGDEIAAGIKPDHVEYDDLTFTVGNKSGASLPDSGGAGTNLFYLIGCILTMLAGAGIVMKKRKRESA